MPPDILHMLAPVTLADRVVTALRGGIDAGRWTNELPSEAALCREFQVSRATLRKGLAQLSRERRISLGGRNHHHRIRGSLATRSDTPGKVVRILSPYAQADMGTEFLEILGILSYRMSGAGYRLEYEAHKGLFSRFRPDDVNHLQDLPETAAWVLLYSDEVMQRWFSNHAPRSVIVGLRNAGVTLSNVNYDMSAAARHAARMLWNRGDHDIAYLIASVTSPNDRLAADVLSHEAAMLGASFRTLPYSPTIPSFLKVADALLESSARPTAFVVSCPEHCLSLLCHLQHLGIKVPDDISILSLRHDACLNYAVPRIAHYRIDSAKMGKKIAATLLKLLESGPGKVSSCEIIPEFVSGGTLKLMQCVGSNI